MKMKYGFLGAGQMGEALFAGMLRQGKACPADVHIAEVNHARAEAMREKYGVTVADACAVVASADLVVLATKPQDMEALLKALPSDGVRGKLFVSIAAGKSLATLEALLPEARVVRVMPNLPMRVGEGMSCFCRGTGVTEADVEAVQMLLGCSGRVREMPETQFDAVTALSGSGPAFVAVIAQAFVDGAVAQGMSAEDARALTLQTLRGTATVLAEGGVPLKEFVEQVTSKGGTTAAGRGVLEGSGMAEIIAQTLKAAADRSRELGNGK